MSNENSFFTKMVDELIISSDYDNELADNIKWLDGQAQKRGISFYDMVDQLLNRHDINSKAKTWMKNR